MNDFIQMLQFPFLQRALIVGVLVSLCAALLGVSLVLKRFSMIGDGLSHVGFASLAIAYAFNAAPLVVSIPVCLCQPSLCSELPKTRKSKAMRRQLF